MSLVRMALGGYRCFQQRQEVELAPVTVVLGRNNSGKSALVRAPVVLSTGIKTDSRAPLDLDMLREFGEDMPDSFTDLIYGSRPHGSINVELEVTGDDGGSVTLAATIQNIDEYRTQVVSSFILRSRHEVTRLEWEPGDPPTPAVYVTYSDEEPAPTSRAEFEFTGLLPSPSPSLPLDSSAEALRRDRSAILVHFPKIRYFGPFRDRPRREYRLPFRMPTEAGISGENAAGMLASDYIRGEGQMLSQVNQDLAEHLPGWKLDIVEQGRGYAVMLTSLTDNTLRVNLADAGTGVAQVLPVFVQRAADSVNPPSEPVLEIIEQPELHLHPGAHGALADLYLAAVQRHESDVRFLIETHSETFLLRLRRRIAEGLDPSRVGVYFVENADSTAIVRKVNIDRAGNLDYWPTGVFSEDYEETRALAAAQLDRRDASAC